MVDENCPICWRQDGTHATVFHVWMPAEEQQRVLVWFSAAVADAWLRRRLAEFD